MKQHAEFPVPRPALKPEAVFFGCQRLDPNAAVFGDWPSLSEQFALAALGTSRFGATGFGIS